MVKELVKGGNDLVCLHADVSFHACTVGACTQSTRRIMFGSRLCQAACADIRNIKLLTGVKKIPIGLVTTPARLATSCRITAE